MRKITAGIFLGTFALALAGCGSKAVPTPNQVQPQNSSVKSDQANSEQMVPDKTVQKMPEATGKVDDTVDAIISGATNEGVQATSTDTDATSAVDDGQDTNKLNSTYDENAL